MRDYEGCWHVTQATDEEAIAHARRCIGIQDKPEIGLGWKPYNYLVTRGAISQWACHTEDEFNRRLARYGLRVDGWSEWRDGIRSSTLSQTN